MAISASTFRLYLQGFDSAPTPYTSGVVATKSIERVLQDGDGAGEVRCVRDLDQTLGAGGTLALDLKLDTDAYGVPLALDEMVVIYVENASDGNGGVVEIRPGGANPFTNLLGAGSAVLLPKGCAAMFFLADLDQVNKWPVAAGNKTLAIVETGAALTCHMIVQIWGRK